VNDGAVVRSFGLADQVLSPFLPPRSIGGRQGRSDENAVKLNGFAGPTRTRFCCAFDSGSPAAPTGPRVVATGRAQRKSVVGVVRGLCPGGAEELVPACTTPQHITPLPHPGQEQRTTMSTGCAAASPPPRCTRGYSPGAPPGRSAGRLSRVLARQNTHQKGNALLIRPLLLSAGRTGGGEMVTAREQESTRQLSPAGLP
jgi:hypothetical protein